MNSSWKDNVQLPPTPTGLTDEALAELVLEEFVLVELELVLAELPLEEALLEVVLPPLDAVDCVDCGGVVLATVLVPLLEEPVLVEFPVDATVFVPLLVEALVDVPLLDALVDDVPLLVGVNDAPLVELWEPPPLIDTLLVLTWAVPELVSASLALATAPSPPPPPQAAREQTRIAEAIIWLGLKCGLKMGRDELSVIQYSLSAGCP